MLLVIVCISGLFKSLHKTTKQPKRVISEEKCNLYREQVKIASFALKVILKGISVRWNRFSLQIMRRKEDAME